ncbi:MAG: methyltransferase domain-containing protein [Rhodothermales bacterium]
MSNCPVCHAPRPTDVVVIDRVPVLCNELHDSEASALNAVLGDLHVVFCTRCGHLFNAAFDPARIDYTTTYENSLHHSPRFQAFADALADELAERYALKDRTVVEIGCGQGDFLKLLCARGGCDGIGFDPSYIGPDVVSDRVRIARAAYAPAYADLDAAMVYCRHVLEHIPDPAGFIRSLHDTIAGRPDTVVYMEVPNTMATLREDAIWDLIYEHCGYYTPESIAYLFASNGFEVLRVTPRYAGQFLSIEARPLPERKPAQEPDTTGLARDVAAFADAYRAKIARWSDELRAVASAGRRAVIWGAGSKGNTFLNTVGRLADIAYAIDINPRKLGKFITGTGQEIRPPEFLTTYKPDVVILMNAIYQEEVRQTLATMNLTPQLITA